MPSAARTARRRWADKYDRRDGPPVNFTEQERSHAINMALGSRVLVKSVLATGKTYGPLTPDHIEVLKREALL